MKDTVKANNKFVIKIVNENKKYVKVYDGNEYCYTAKLRTYEDYIDEVKNENNECAVFWNKFTDSTGKQYIEWFDYETYETFLSEIK